MAISNYDDIIELPRHVSSARLQMPMIDRAAKFSPFAALVGFDAAISILKVMHLQLLMNIEKDAFERLFQYITEYNRKPLAKRVVQKSLWRREKHPVKLRDAVCRLHQR